MVSHPCRKERVKDGAPGCLFSMVCVLQLLQSASDFKGDALHGSRNREPHLDDSGIDCGMKMSEAPVLEYKKLTAA